MTDVIHNHEEMTQEELEAHNLVHIEDATNYLQTDNELRLAVLKGKGIEVDPLDLISIKLDLLLQLLAPSESVKGQISYLFQEKLHNYIHNLEIQTDKAD